MSAPDISGTNIVLSCAADILTLSINGSTSNCKVPRGERGPAGRDGMNIRGDIGPVGPKGDGGRDGRDSTVLGPKGDKGDIGQPGPAVKFSIGSVSYGDSPNVILSQSDIFNYILNFQIPKGTQGIQGLSGKNGKHGTHEIIEFTSVGHNPRFSNEFMAKHCIADGICDLPEWAEGDIGRWVYFKTFDRLVLNNCVEGSVVLDKNQSAKMVVVPYIGKFIMTRF